MEALILTIILECLVLFALKEKEPLFFLYWICITTLTNIPANILAAPAFSRGRAVLYLTVAAIEVAVFILEAFMCYLYKKDKRKSIIYSAVCNASSFLTGGLITLIF